MTTALLACGVVGAIGFLAVALAEGARRDGYVPTYHPVSALSLGDRGWVQVVNFVVTGALMVLFGAGVHRVTGSVLGAVLLAAFGAGLVLSGVFSMDPMRGYPPGTPATTPTEHSTAHRLHDWTGLVVFLAVPAACVALAFVLTGPWRVYTVATAVAGLGLLGWFGQAWEVDAPNAGAVQRLLIAVNWIWIALLGVHLARW